MGVAQRMLDVFKGVVRFLGNRERRPRSIPRTCRRVSSNNGKSPEFIAYDVQPIALAADV